MIECISTNRRALPPLVIYKGKSAFIVTENKWTTNKTVVTWLEETGLWPVSKTHPPKNPIVAKATLKKAAELKGQLSLYNKLSDSGSSSTQRLLFRKVQKAFNEKDYQLGAAQLKISIIESQIDNIRKRKRYPVKTDPNVKFAKIKDIRQAQINASEVNDSTAEVCDSDSSSESKSSCIIVAGG
ncbi:transposase [Colletotrichum incanum]|uniref:Transposase n=1 Tax=Colletotrichum incanum TaxID=1573173 RepID=A0A161WA08_COLIC|nr:transposase [Colletotrichum incanum]